MGRHKKAQLGKGVDRWEDIHQDWPLYDIASHIPTRSVLGRTVGGRVGDQAHLKIKFFFFSSCQNFFFQKGFCRPWDASGFFYDALGLFLLQYTLLGFLYYTEGFFLWFSRGTTRIQNE